VQKLLKIACLLFLLAPALASGQTRVRIPTPITGGQQNIVFQGGGQPAPNFGAGANGQVVVQPQQFTTPQITVPGGNVPQLGQPRFDPFATNPNAANTAPALVLPQGAPYQQQGFPQQPPVLNPGTWTQPQLQQQPNGFGFNPNAQPGWGPGSVFADPAAGPYMRLFQELRLNYTWLYGDPLNDPNDLQMHDIELGTTVNFPNFLWSGQPIHVSPGFILHLWDGPGAGVTADLPSKAYSAYVNTYYSTNPAAQVGAEVDVTVGVFSDFNTVTTDSVRIFGTGLGFYRLSPTLTLKGGVTYLDRVDLKLLPAGGLFWRPNEDVYFEIYFPRPKLAQRLRVVGNTEIWGYIGGEYGGGSWTVERTSGVSERVDINDLRGYIGLEFKSLVSSFRGYAEAGYVFERELVYDKSTDGIELDDTFMVRGGLIY